MTKVPRQFLEVLCGPNRKPFTKGGGRMELAEAIANNEGQPAADCAGDGESYLAASFWRGIGAKARRVTLGRVVKRRVTPNCSIGWRIISWITGGR